jgi:hypothetical protein
MEMDGLVFDRYLYGELFDYLYVNAIEILYFSLKLRYQGRFESFKGDFFVAKLE